MASDGMPQENTRVLFVKDPEGGHVDASHMKVVTEPFTLPTELEPGTLVVRNLYLSLDPYMRGRMNTREKGYFMPPFPIGDVITTGGVAEVIAGQRDGFSVGDLVAPFVGLETFSVLPPRARVQKLPADLPIPPSYFLGVLGVPGATAYHGLALSNPKPGQTLFVSGAAGAVGQLVGQIGKIKGMKVIGSAGTDEKVELLKTKFGFDEAFNYKKVDSLEKTLASLAPGGIDVYFDNVGADHLDAALGCMNSGGHIIACGMIATYNGQSYAFKNMKAIVFKELKMIGFIIAAQLADPEFMARFSAEMVKWLTEGKIQYLEDVVEGLEKAPDAFVGLFTGANVGKLLIKP